MRLRTPLAFAVALAAILPAPALAAEAFYGVTTENQLVTFASDSPGAVRSSVPLTGLAEGERILGIDVRPATGQLYALGTTNRVFVVSPLSGAARPLGGPFSPPLAGTAFGFDFNPQSDRIRVVSDGRQNLRLNPDDGQVTNADNALAYADGDPNAGANPAVTGAAYTNNVAGAKETQLFDIDTARDVLVLQNPNAGTLTTVGPLNVDVNDPVSFDVAADGRAFVSAQRAGQPGPELFTVDLKTGALTPAAGDRSFAGAPVRGIAAAGPVPDDKGAPAVVVSADRLATRSSLRRALRFSASCSEACALEVMLLRGTTTLERSRGALAAAGRTGFALKASNARKRLARSRSRVTLTLRVIATDAAGNQFVTRRTIRFG